MGVAHSSCYKLLIICSTYLSYVSSTPSNEKTMVLRLAADLKAEVLLGLQRSPHKKINTLVKVTMYVCVMHDSCPQFRGKAGN